MKRAFLKFGHPESIATRNAAESEGAGPLEKMHASFGVKPKQLCGACKHYRLDSYSTVRCAVYHQFDPAQEGYWDAHWTACGKWART